MRREKTVPDRARILLACAALVALVCPGSRAGAESGWQLEQPEQPIRAVAQVEETVWQMARSTVAFDRIGVHRYRDPTVSARAVLLYLPGTNMNGVLAIEDQRYNLWLWLAHRGVEVYALDYRTHTVTPSHGGSAPTDFGFMKSWTMEEFTADARLALGLVGDQSPERPVFVAGFSRGASFAYSLACSVEEGALSGVIALDGTWKSVGALAEPAPVSLGAALDQFAESGRFESDVAAGIGWEPRAQLMAEVVEDPDGTASQDGFETIGLELAELLFRAWGPGRLAHPIGASSGMGISRPEVLAELLAGYDRYYPAVQDVQGRAFAAVLDHPETAIDDCFGELELPILFLGSSGMGPSWLLDGIFSAARSGSKQVEIHVLEGYGHLDVLVAETAVTDVFESVLGFIERNLAR